MSKSRSILKIPIICGETKSTALFAWYQDSLQVLAWSLLHFRSTFQERYPTFATSAMTVAHSHVPGVVIEAANRPFQISTVLVSFFQSVFDRTLLFKRLSNLFIEVLEKKNSIKQYGITIQTPQDTLGHQ
jgi:hypothetical protein